MKLGEKEEEKMVNKQVNEKKFIHCKIFIDENKSKTHTRINH